MLVDWALLAAIACLGIIMCVLSVTLLVVIFMRERNDG